MERADVVAAFQRLHFDTSFAEMQVLVAATVGSPDLAGALHELCDGEWTAPALASSTRRVDAQRWRAFKKWCREHDLEALPATAKTVARYAADRSETVKTKTVNQELDTIGRHHRSEGAPDPTGSVEIRQLLEGLARSEALALSKPSTDDGPASFEELRLLIDEVNGGGYWSKYLKSSDPGKREVARLLAGRWKAVILTEWAGALSARQSLTRTIDDLVTDDGLRIMLPATLEHPRGVAVVIPRFEDPAYDPETALCEWREMLEPYLPACGALFPKVYFRPTVQVVCGVCGPSGEPERQNPDALDYALANAARSDASQFNDLAAGAGLREQRRVLTRGSLRSGVGREAAGHGVSTETIRRHLRRVRVEPFEGDGTAGFDPQGLV